MAVRVNSKPRLLDLCCGPGGASAGYSDAGFDITGVDHISQPSYPYRFILCDAIDYAIAHSGEYDVIHASPPCQLWSKGTKWKPGGTKAVNLIPSIRAALLESGKPYIIENVPDAPLINPVMLCGRMFSLDVIRHRLFEASVELAIPDHLPHSGKYEIFEHKSEARYKEAMWVMWMTAREARQAIPPAYTRYIGVQIMGLLV